MSKPIPLTAPTTGNAALDDFARAVKVHVDTLTGQKANSTKLAPLPSTATLADVIASFNVLVDRLGQ